MIARAVLLFVTFYAVMTLALLGLLTLPDIALLRYAVLALPVLASTMVVISWLERGAPWPSASRLRRHDVTRTRSQSIRMREGTHAASR